MVIFGDNVKKVQIAIPKDPQKSPRPIYLSHLLVPCNHWKITKIPSFQNIYHVLFWTWNFKKFQLGRTECIDNDLNPTFKEKIILQYNSDEFQKLIFKVWDIDDNENDISKADFLGDMDCTLQELVDCSTFSKPLRYEGSDFGKIFVSSFNQD